MLCYIGKKGKTPDQCSFTGVEQYDSLGASTISGKVLPWMQKTFQGMGGGLRRFDKERLFAFINCVAAGILTAPKILYTVETVTQLAHNCPRTFVAVVLLPNRAGDLRTALKKLRLMEQFFV